MAGKSLCPARRATTGTQAWARGWVGVTGRQAREGGGADPRRCPPQQAQGQRCRVASAAFDLLTSPAPSDTRPLGSGRGRTPQTAALRPGSLHPGHTGARRACPVGLALYPGIPATVIPQAQARFSPSCGRPGRTPAPRRGLAKRSGAAAEFKCVKLRQRTGLLLSGNSSRDKNICFMLRPRQSRSSPDTAGGAGLAQGPRAGPWGCRQHPSAGPS